MSLESYENAISRPCLGFDQCLYLGFTHAEYRSSQVQFPRIIVADIKHLLDLGDSIMKRSPEDADDTIVYPDRDEDITYPDVGLYAESG